MKIKPIQCISCGKVHKRNNDVKKNTQLDKNYENQTNIRNKSIGDKIHSHNRIDAV